MSKEITSTNRKSKKEILTSALFIFFIISTFVSLFLIIHWFFNNKKINDIENNINEITKIEEVSDNDNAEIINPPKENVKNDYWDFIKLPLINVDFSKLIETNKDTVGWINVNNTNINYPVVQASNNDYYLNRAFDSSKNQAGWIFADYRNDMKNFDKNTIIYGHSRRNNTMFGSLFNVLNKSWYTNKYNHIIKFSTPYENTMWQIFSVYKINAESYYLTINFNNDYDYNNFLNTLKKRSIYNFNVELHSSDKIITLSTCSDSTGNGRIVVHAKLIKREGRI